MLHFRNGDRPRCGQCAVHGANVVRPASARDRGRGPASTLHRPDDLRAARGRPGRGAGVGRPDRLRDERTADERGGPRQCASAAATDAVVLERRRIVRRPAISGTDRSGIEAQGAVAGAPDADLSATEAATLLQNFVGATLGETGSLPPDPSGAAGPTQFILAANGRIRSFAKATGVADGVLNLSTNSFFTPVRAGANTFGPKVKYDRLAGRWFIIAATDAVPGRIVIASSNASTITGPRVWSFFAFDNRFPSPGPTARSIRRRSGSTRGALRRRGPVLRSRRRRPTPARPASSSARRR